MTIENFNEKSKRVRLFQDDPVHVEVVDPRHLAIIACLTHSRGSHALEVAQPIPDSRFRDDGRLVVRVKARTLDS